MNPSLIALDWGTSNLRATLLDAHGQALEQRSAPGGIMKVQDGQFGAVLLALCGDWVSRFDAPLIASGMIGSRQGWKEAPYLSCPATLAQAASALVSVDIGSGGAAPRLLHIAPGLSCMDARGEADVMRGEETQIWGAGLASGSLCVLPGTHSKWAWLGDQGGIARFQTCMTGELFGLLTQHSILGRLMHLGAADAPLHRATFEQGARLGLAGHANLSHTIFAARTAGLMGRLPAEDLPDFLSGILIGAEIGGATADAPAQRQVSLIGEDSLCQRYELALGLHGLASERARGDATTQGQWQLACAAALVVPG